MPNTIAENLQRLVDAKNDIIDAIIAKGGTVNEGDGLEEFPADIATIPVGGDSHFATNLVVTTEPGAVVTATRVSIQLNVKAENEAPITITDGFTTLTGTGTGDWQVFWLPNMETWTASTGTTLKKINVSDTTPKSVDLTFSIYGVEWAGTSDPSCTRTDDSVWFDDPDPYVADGSHPGSSPFDALMPWSGMVKETIGEDVFVKIPKFWFKITKVGTKRKIQIADKAVDGFMVSPAHQDRGDGNGERDYVYVSRYHVSTGYKSKSGVQPLVASTRGIARHGCSSRGADYCQFDMMTLITIWYLYLVEFAHWNSQLKIGYGNNALTSIQNTGASDSMPYHTGTMQSSRSSNGVGTQYRWLEDLWGNIYEWVDGIYFSGSSIFAIKNPANFSDSTNGTNVGFSRPTTSTNWPVIASWGDSNVSGYEWFTYPKSTAQDGNYSTYCCDNVVYGSSGQVLCFGGQTNGGSACGLFHLNGAYSSSYTYDYRGARLMYLPSNNS